MQTKSLDASLSDVARSKPPIPPAPLSAPAQGGKDGSFMQVMRDNTTVVVHRGPGGSVKIAKAPMSTGAISNSSNGMHSTLSSYTVLHRWPCNALSLLNYQTSLISYLSNSSQPPSTLSAKIGSNFPPAQGYQALNEAFNSCRNSPCKLCK